MPKKSRATWRSTKACRSSPERPCSGQPGPAPWAMPSARCARTRICRPLHGWSDVTSLCARSRVCRPLHGWSGVTSLCARSRDEPSSAHCEQRLSERLTPCPCDPVCACTGIRGHAGKRKATRISVCAPTRSAANRVGMAGWAGEGGGRFGERREYEAPTLPSPPRQHGMARHHKRQPRNSSPPHTPSNKQHGTLPHKPAQQRQHVATRHHTRQPKHTPTPSPDDSRKTRLVKMRIAATPYTGTPTRQAQR